jgi:hypothetical protein
VDAGGSIDYVQKCGGEQWNNNKIALYYLHNSGISLLLACGEKICFGYCH